MFLCMYVFCLQIIKAIVKLWMVQYLVSLDWLGLTSFPVHHGKPGQRPGNETNLPHIGFCLPVVLAHGGAGGETCMDVLVTSADVKPRPWKLFPRPEGLQILSFIVPFFDPFPNPFHPVLDGQLLSYRNSLRSCPAFCHWSCVEAGSLVKSISVHAYIQRLHAVWPENECLYHIWSPCTQALPHFLACGGVWVRG